MQDIDGLSVEDLKKLRARADALIESKKDQEVEDAYNSIVATANSVGLSLEELIEFGATKHKKAPRKAVEPRYRNLNDPEQTWTGRGKQPRWLVAELEKGASLESFRI
jgi:DNA-binding protein H-NS